MSTGFRLMLGVLILACAAPTLATGQTGLPGGVGASARPLIEEGRPYDRAAAFTTGRAAVTWLLGSAGRAGENASVFSAFGGFSLQGRLPVEGVLTYAHLTPEGLEGVNVVQGALEVGLPVAALAQRGIVLAVGGDAQWTEGSGQGYAIRLAVSKTLRRQFEAGGSVAYQGDEPDEGDAKWGIVPAITAAAVVLPNTSLRGNYTFDNEIDGDHSYDVVITRRMELRRFPPFQLRAGVNNNLDISAGVVVFF